MYPDTFQACRGEGQWVAENTRLTTLVLLKANLSLIQCICCCCCCCSYLSSRGLPSLSFLRPSLQLCLVTWCQRAMYRFPDPSAPPQVCVLLRASCISRTDMLQETQSWAPLSAPKELLSRCLFGRRDYAILFSSYASKRAWHDPSCLTSLISVPDFPAK